MNITAGRLGIPLALAIAVLCAWRAGNATADFSDVRIAVADISRIFDAYEKRDYYQAELDKRRESINQRENSFEQRLGELRERMDRLSMGSPQRQDIRNQLARAEEEYLQYQRQAAREMDELLKQGRMEIYQDILDVIEEYALQNKIDLVIKQQTSTREQPTAGDLSLRIAERGVLYSAERLDITQEIADMLNQKYWAAEEQRDDGAGRTQD